MQPTVLASVWQGIKKSLAGLVSGLPTFIILGSVAWLLTGNPAVGFLIAGLAMFATSWTSAYKQRRASGDGILLALDVSFWDALGVTPLLEAVFDPNLTPNQRAEKAGEGGTNVVLLLLVVGLLKKFSGEPAAEPTKPPVAKSAPRSR